jgi:hypothetical protein
MSTITAVTPLQRSLRALSWALMLVWLVLIGAAVFPLPRALFAPNPRPVPHFYPGQIVANADGQVLADSTGRTIQVYGADGELDESRPMPAEQRRGYQLAISHDGTLLISTAQRLFAWRQDGWERVAPGDEPPYLHAPGALSGFQDLDGSTLRHTWLGIVREGPDGEELARYAPPVWVGIVNWRSAVVLFPLFMLVLLADQRSRRTTGRASRPG